LAVGKPFVSVWLNFMHFLDLTLSTVVANLAMDEAIVVAAEADEGPTTLRVWELDHHAVVLGASGKIGVDVNRANCLADGVPLARRSSGGGTVLLGPGALNFAVVLPVEADPRLKAVDTAQVWVLETAAEALRGLGHDVQVLGSGDLTIAGRKFSGSAQRRLKRFVMIHASLIYAVGPGTIARYLSPPERQPAYREGRSHEDFLTILPATRIEIVGALREAFQANEILERGPLDLADRLISEKFGRNDWIERA
jgi:lipoate-protein ligase A